MKVNGKIVSDQLKTLIVQKLQEMTEQECVIVLTGGHGFPEPKIYGNKQEQFTGVLKTENIA